MTFEDKAKILDELRERLREGSRQEFNAAQRRILGGDLKVGRAVFEPSSRGEPRHFERMIVPGPADELRVKALSMVLRILLHGVPLAEVRETAIDALQCDGTADDLRRIALALKEPARLHGLPLDWAEAAGEGG